MKHPGDRISALVDERLDHDSRDQVLGHLLDCAQCRAEADAQRLVKRRLTGGDSIDQVEPPEALVRRLRIVPTLTPDASAAPRLTLLLQHGQATERPGDRYARRRYRRRIALAGSLSIGAATVAVAFVVGGQQDGPAVSPPVASYTVEHAVTSRSVPLTDPAAEAVSVVRGRP